MEVDHISKGKGKSKSNGKGKGKGKSKSNGEDKDSSKSKGKRQKQRDEARQPRQRVLRVWKERALRARLLVESKPRQKQ